MEASEIVRADRSVQRLDEGAFLLAVSAIETDEQAREFLREMLEAKEAVMNIRRLAHLRVQFTHMENMAYMELYEQGRKKVLREINASLAAACKWVTGLGEDERSEVMSGEQGTILQQYRVAKKDSDKAEAMQYAMEMGEAYRNAMLKGFKETGKVKLTTEAARNWVARGRNSKHVPDEYIRDLVDGTKDKVLKAGGYGIGNGEYTLITDEFELRQAIAIRAKSIGADMKKVAELMDWAHEKGIASPTLVLDGVNTVNRNLSVTSLGYLVLLLNPITRNAFRWYFTTGKVKEHLAFNIRQILENEESHD